jgi:hypothetical protein
MPAAMANKFVNDFEFWTEASLEHKLKESGNQCAKRNCISHSDIKLIHYSCLIESKNEIELTK